MAGILVAVRSAVDHEMIARSGSRDVVTSLGKSTRRSAKASRSIVRAIRRSAKASPSICRGRRHPQQFFGRRFDPQLRLIQHGRRDRQAVARVVRIPSRHRHQRAAVVVSDVRKAARVVREETRGGGEATGGMLEVGGCGIAGEASDRQREEIKVEWVVVVVRRTQ